jgi:hypothetical protein
MKTVDARSRFSTRAALRGKAGDPARETAPWPTADGPTVKLNGTCSSSPEEEDSDA